MVYQVELHPGESGESRYCLARCVHCPYSDRDPLKDETVGYSDRVLETYAKIANQIEAEGRVHHLLPVGSLAKLDAQTFPGIGTSVEFVRVNLGQLADQSEQTIYRSMDAAIALLSGKVLSGERKRKPLLFFTYEDQSADFHYNFEKVGMTLGVVAKAYAERAREFRRIGFGHYFGISLNGNSIGDEAFEALWENRLLFHGKLSAISSLINKMYGVDGSADLGSRFSIEGDKNWLTFDLTTTKGNSEMHFLGARYFRNSKGIVTLDDAIDTSGITLFPHKVLIDHMTRTINTGRGWMEYDEFEEVLERAQESGKSLKKTLDDHFDQ